MYIACEKCKYNHEGECDFYNMGSGNEIDMPWYREKILIKEAADNFLHTISTIKDGEISIIFRNEVGKKITRTGYMVIGIDTEHDRIYFRESDRRRRSKTTSYAIRAG